ncbi:MarR family winged helix-turn-helix transcriptional regulator [Nonomuraea cavernae]|uniref:MarR family transcriptional regulator n=1 Tax=Nonomuraea cavernae TaxID=2045107 RepID=A0A918DGK7_9ACTN|nr:MarR family transcriptional regulator [Nonomuraea cavernae]MCA2184569.1 MarR family transcriptional regulator [Nonomuraea cavernae]GGO63394.1 MarR family transcriptional regulator [Nonomuraea cavernae]
MSVKNERDDLIHRITEAQRGLGRAFAQHQSPLFASNLTMRQLKVVMLLSIHGSASGQELATGLGVGLGTVTGIVDRLVAQGLVSRHEDPHDRRVRRVELTDAGLRLMEEINDAGLEQYNLIMRHLDIDTLRALDMVLGRICAVADELFGPSRGSGCGG